MAKRPADHRSFNERIYPIVSALQKRGYATIMPDHPDADEDTFIHWVDAVVQHLESDTPSQEASPTEQHLQLQCVVAENIRRLANLIDHPCAGAEDVGQQLDFVVDDVIDIVEKIVARNEQLANQLEDCRAGIAAVRSLDKPHNPLIESHREVRDEDAAPTTGKASTRPATPEDGPPLREVDPLEVRVRYPEEPAARNTATQGLTRQLPKRPLPGPWR